MAIATKLTRAWRPPTAFLLALVALAAGSCGCEDGNGFGVLEVAVEAEPTRFDIDALWGGSIRTRTVQLRNVGEATARLGTPVVDEEGPAQASVALAGDRIATGATLNLTLTVTGDENATGQYLLQVTIPVDGADDVVVDLFASVRPSPECDDANSCTQDRFDILTGECIFETVPDFTPCDDDNACTETDLCLTGRCIGNVIECDDNVPCTIDGCDAQTGCIFEPAPSRCDDENPCTEDECTPGFGCQNPPVIEPTLCHFNGCEDIGFCAGPACIVQEVPDGVPCEDGDACTLNDTCQQGLCAPGVRGTPGAADPIPLTDGAPLTFRDCAHPLTRACPLQFSGFPEEVLAVTRAGPLSVVAFRTAFTLSDTGELCDPSIQLTSIPNRVADAGPGDAGSPGGPAEPPPPPPPTCAAGVFVVAYADALPPPINQPTTLVTHQVGVAYGPVAAAFGDFDPVAQTAQIKWAHYSFYSPELLWVQSAAVGLDQVQTDIAPIRLNWPELPGLAPQHLTVAKVDGSDDLVVTAFPQRRHDCITACESPLFDTTQLPVWLVKADAVDPDLVGAINLSDQTTCNAIGQPLDVVHPTLTVNAARRGILSFVSSLDACQPRPRPWRLFFDIDAIPTFRFGPLPGPEEFLPDAGADEGFDAGSDEDAEDLGLDGGLRDGGTQGVAPFDTVSMEYNLPDLPSVVVEEFDCESLDGPRCRRVVLTDDNGVRQTVVRETASQNVAAAPFGVDNSHRTAVFLNKRAEMRWYDEQMSLRRLPAPALENYEFVGDRVSFARGETGESLATIGSEFGPCDGEAADCEGLPPVRKSVILQRFSCGFGVGERDLGEPCETSDQCAAGQGCDFEQGCQPPPDCAEGPCLQECWGICAEPSGQCSTRPSSLCDADGNCRYLTAIERCVDANDCDDDSCPDGTTCTEVVESCEEDLDAGCTSVRTCLSTPDGGPDAGVLDGGPDAGVLDGGPVDSGPIDSGAGDAGPSLPTDGGPLDGGAPDSGTG